MASDNLFQNYNFNKILVAILNYFLHFEQISGKSKLIELNFIDCLMQGIGAACINQIFFKSKQAIVITFCKILIINLNF